MDESLPAFGDEKKSTRDPGWAPPPDFISTVKDAADDKIVDETTWAACLRFLEGDQTLDSFATTKTPERLKDKEKTGFVFDMITSAYNRMTAQLAISCPRVMVKPATNEDDDIVKSEASGEVVRSAWTTQGMDEVMDTAILDLVSMGPAFLWEYYDPDTQEIVTEAPSPFDVVKPKGCDKFKKARWIAVHSYKDRDDCAATWKDKADLIMQAPLVSEDEAPKNSVEVWDVYWRTGHHAIYVGTTLVWQDRFNPKAFPVQMMGYTRIPRRFWPMGLVANLLDAQLVYNRHRNQQIDTYDLMGRPKVVIPTTAQLPPNAFSGRTGEKLYVNPMVSDKLRYLTPPSVPAESFQLTAQLRSEIAEIGSVPPAVMGGSQPGMRSADQQQIAIAQGTAGLRMCQSSIRAAIEEWARVVLTLTVEHYDEGRYVRAFDAEGAFIGRWVPLTQLFKDPEVFVEAGLFKEERDEHEATVIRRVQSGVWTPEQGQDELDFGTFNRPRNDKIRRKAMALRVLRAVQQGAQVELYPTDDFDALKDVFDRFIQGEEFHDTAKTPPEIQERIVEVFKAIIELRAQKEQEALMRAQAGLRPSLIPTNPNRGAQGPQGRGAAGVGTGGGPQVPSAGGMSPPQMPAPGA